MNRVSTPALRLGGFLLAHAFWIMAELGEGELYVPRVLCETGAARQLFVFEAATQAEAVMQGKQFLEERIGDFDRCAFARDGLIRTEDGPIDVLVLDIVEGGPRPALTVVQPYGRAQTGAFQLSGDEVLLSEEAPVPSTEGSELSKSLRSGASDHERARAVWQRLDAERTAANPLR